MSIIMTSKFLSEVIARTALNELYAKILRAEEPYTQHFLDEGGNRSRPFLTTKDMYECGNEDQPGSVANATSYHNYKVLYNMYIQGYR